MRILIVDDDSDIRNLLKRVLESKEREILTAEDGREALVLVGSHDVDLVILDIGLPEPDGWGVLQTIRDTSRVPVIMLTAKDSPSDISRGLLLGADDYIAKPFDLAVLEARITAVMRRVEARTDSSPQVISIGNLTIDNDSKTVLVRGVEISLTPMEFELLRLMASRPGHVFSSSEIIRDVWHDKQYVTAADVTKYVYLLRKKLGDAPEKPTLIENVRGFGYRLIV
jgi:DNA-binding response OmpR family regulator